LGFHRRIKPAAIAEISFRSKSGDPGPKRRNLEKVVTFVPARGRMGRRNVSQMKTSSKTVFFLVALSILIGVSVVWGQNDPQVAIAKKQAELDRQRIELEKKSLELKQKELDLERARQEFEAQQSGRSLSMNLSGDVLFDYDRAALKPEAEQALKKVAVVLSQFPESKVTVEGYTDSKGTKAANMQLSRERAQAVKDWLVKNGGVLTANMSTKGFGEQYPVAPNRNKDGSDNPLGRALNRRVSIIVEKPAATTP